MDLRFLLTSQAIGFGVGAVDASYQGLSGYALLRKGGLFSAAVVASRLANTLLVGAVASLAGEVGCSNRTISKIACAVTVASDAAFFATILSLQLISRQSLAIYAVSYLCNRSLHIYAVLFNKYSFQNLR